VTVVEELARATAGLVATVGRMEVEPNATNCVPRRVRTSLDVRSASDAVRLEAVLGMTDAAAEIGRQSRVGVEVRYDHEHSATPMDAALTAKLAAAIERAGGEPHTLVSGAGHDAGMMAAVAPAAMLFVRCRGGVSHDPTEFCSREDVTAALGVMGGFVEQLATRDIGA
jgi:allantoate deiminase